MGKYWLIQRGRRFFFLLACLFFALPAIGCWATKKDTEKLDEVKAIWSRLPIYPGMREVNSKTESGFGKAFVSKSFQSAAPYNEVKGFYIEHLRQEGWQVTSDRKLKDWGGDPERHYIEFHRREIFLSIEYVVPSSGYNWQYAIAIHWSRWDQRK